MRASAFSYISFIGLLKLVLPNSNCNLPLTVKEAQAKYVKACKIFSSREAQLVKRGVLRATRLVSSSDYFPLEFVFVCITVFEEIIQRNSLLHTFNQRNKDFCSFTIIDPALQSHSLPTPPLPPHLLWRSWKLEQRQKTVTKCKI